jgi:hypothetical protein
VEVALALFSFPEFRSEVDEAGIDVAFEAEAPAVPPPRPQYAGLYVLAGDFRGRYGYGRAAHGSDPRASYGFQPVNRVLPPRAR